MLKNQSSKFAKDKTNVKPLAQSKAERHNESDIRYSNKRLVTQEQMDEALRSGFVCLENWELIK